MIWWNGRTKKIYSFEIIEKYDSYTRAGKVITVDGINYVIESTEHRLSNGWHFNKLELRRLIMYKKESYIIYIANRKIY